MQCSRVRVLICFFVPLMQYMCMCLLQVQTIKLMMSMAELRQMVLAALNYHVMPHRQPLHQHIDSQLRCCRKQLVSIGGREIHPHPGLHDEVYVYSSVGDSDFGTTMMAAPCRRHLATLPNALSHMQVVVFSNFLYILGGCTTQCAHGESAVNLVLRYDPRFNTWLQVKIFLKIQKTLLSV